MHVLLYDKKLLHKLFAMCSVIWFDKVVHFRCELIFKMEFKLLVFVEENHNKMII